ncbi:MAG: hypothetical protein N4A33_02525 [Bacteriovoracaceae bacterium]|jgi:hypothetical protein|nr:hypothetical protein [Bacteriovoracaceae bacterium]
MKALLIFSFFISHLYAGKYWVKFANDREKLSRINQVLINFNCNKCQASKYLKYVVNLNYNEIKYINPYSIACKKVGGKVRIGKLFNGHSQSFCFFSDNSFISTNTFKIKMAR